MASIYSKNGILYLSWYDSAMGKSKNRSTRLKDSPANRKLLEKKKKVLEEEIEKNQNLRNQTGVKRNSIAFAFQHFLNNNSGKHAKTIKDYWRFYNKFKESFDVEQPCAIITKLSAEEWINQIKKMPKSRNTIFGYFKQFNHFLNFLFEYNYILFFKINRDVKPKPEIKEKIVFGTNDLKRVFDGVENKGSNLKTFVYLAFYTGLRSTELLSLTVDRINLEKMEMTYASPKRKTFRTVPIHKELVPILKARIAELKEGKLIGYENVENLSQAFRKYRQELGMNTPYTPRTFRKTFITLARSYGMDATIVAELVGHEHTTTADRYYNQISMPVLAKELRKYKKPYRE